MYNIYMPLFLLKILGCPGTTWNRFAKMAATVSHGPEQQPKSPQETYLHVALPAPVGLLKCRTEKALSGPRGNIIQQPPLLPSLPSSQAGSHTPSSLLLCPFLPLPSLLPTLPEKPHHPALLSCILPVLRLCKTWL